MFLRRGPPILLGTEKTKKLLGQSYADHEPASFDTFLLCKNTQDDRLFILGPNHSLSEDWVKNQVGWVPRACPGAGCWVLAQAPNKKTRN